MTKSKRGRYTLEFKREAVRLVEVGPECGVGGADVGRGGTDAGQLDQSASRRQPAGAAGKAQVTAEQMEISRLRAELARVTMERDILGKATAYFAKGAEVRYAFVERHKRVWPVCVQCRVLRVSVSGYHQHVRRRKQIAQRRHLTDEALLVHIGAVFAAHRGAYGWPRVWRQLLSQGIHVGKLRVQRLMQRHNIRARGKRRFRVATTDSRHGLPVAPNLLDRNFTVASPNRAWGGDVTYIPTEEGWLYLAVVIDLFSRPDRGLVDAQQHEKRARHRRAGDGLVPTLALASTERSIFHSDRGS